MVDVALSRLLVLQAHLSSSPTTDAAPALQAICASAPSTHCCGCSSSTGGLSVGFHYSPAVQDALSKGLPVVALESTIISHGMPFPDNLRTAKAVEDVVRQHGAVPATIAVLDGVPCIGLTEEQLKRIATESVVHKTSRRDIAHVIARRQCGATTVSATMLLAQKAGIAVFVTGGIGGVHRGGEVTMDVSADLTELGRTPVAVVCAGVKSLLDIPRTLEYLETQGVPTLAYQADEFPAFFTRHSGCKAPARVDSPAEVARVIHVNSGLGLQNGLVLGVPIPDQEAASGAAVEAAIQQALQEAAQQHVQGAAITPFLLSRVAQLTKGASLKSNVALIKHNAAVGAQVAMELAKLKMR